MRYIPLPQIHQLEQHLADLIDSATHTKTRDALAMCLGLHGFRVTEVSQTRADALDINGLLLTPPRIKRSRPRSIGLHPSLVAAIIAWRDGSPCPWLLHTAALNPIHPTHLQRFCRRTTLAVFGFSYRFHALRHTFAMRVYEKTRDLLLVKKLLGHNYVTSTQVYAEALDDTPRDCLVNVLLDSSSSRMGVDESGAARPNVLPVQQLLPMRPCRQAVG